MKQGLLTIFFSFSLIICCQNKKQIDNSTYENKTNTIKKDTMPDLDIKSMKEMLEKEYDNIDSNKPTDFKAIQWTNSEIFKALLKNGYKIPTSEEFQLKMQSIFGINMKIKQTCKWNNVGNEYIIIYGKQYIEDEKRGFNNELRSEYFESVYTENLLFFLDNHFMSFIISPVRIVNFSKDSTHYKVEIPQYVISRNKYLFNDDKSQFSWLTTNDSEFMKSLVTYFGYTEDRKLLKWVFENIQLPYFSKYAKEDILNAFGKILWTKQCDGEINVHQNTLDLIKELSAPDNNLYIMYIAEYLSNLDKYKDLNNSQKAKIAAYLLYWGEQYKYDKRYDFNQMFMGHFYYFMDDGTYEKEFIKNNYYGLPKFKEWYAVAKKEKNIFYDYETYLEDSPQPLDYKFKAKPIK